MQKIFAGEYDVPLAREPVTVLDIGANAGLFSAWATQRWPKAVINAYEPWPENARMFERNLGECSNISLWELGVRGASNEPAYMHRNENPMVHSFRWNTAQDSEGLTLPTIDAHRLPPSEFVKIDTEGCELEIIKGLDLSQTKAIALGAHNWSDASLITDFLTDGDFALHSRRNDDNGMVLLKFLRRSELPKAQKLMVAVPYYGGGHPAFSECLLRLQANPPCDLAIKHAIGDSLVSRARNSLTNDFLRSDCTDLLFIDSDLIFAPEQIGHLAAHDVDLVAGFYPKKQEGALNWVCNALPGELPDVNGLQVVRYMGTGFMRIRRNVFEQMIARFGDVMGYQPDHATHRIEYDFWSVGPYKFSDGLTRYLSEDWYFCQRWLDLGGKVFGDTRIVLRHIGQAIYPLRTQLREIANPNGAQTQNSKDSA